VNSVICTLLVFEVNETVALGITLLIHGNFAGENVSKGGEGVVELLVANGVIQVLDEDISNTCLSDAWITLRPHDPARSAGDRVVVKAVQCPFSIDNAVEIDIGITQRPARESISTNTDRGYWPHSVECFEEKTFRDFRSKVAYI